MMALDETESEFEPLIRPHYASERATYTRAHAGAQWGRWRLCKPRRRRRACGGGRMRLELADDWRGVQQQGRVFFFALGWRFPGRLVPLHEARAFHLAAAFLLLADGLLERLVRGGAAGVELLEERARAAHGLGGAQLGGELVRETDSGRLRRRHHERRREFDGALRASLGGLAYDV